MQDIQGISFYENSREELLPEFSPDFPYISTRVTYAGPVTPWHWHRPVELFYIESGCLEYTTPKGKWIFPAGSGGFVNSNVLHTTWIPPEAGKTVTLLHIFDPCLLGGEPGSRINTKYILPLTADAGTEMIPILPETPEKRDLLRRIRAALVLEEEQWGYELRLREALTAIWLELFALSTPSGTSRGAADRQIKALMVYIHEHFSENISIQQLADRVSVSRRTCFRLFQENVHMSPVEYLRTYRLQQARKLLSETDMPITQIGYSCGLGSASYFGKCFREQFGCTPAEFRKMARSR